MPSSTGLSSTFKRTAPALALLALPACSDVPLATEAARLEAPDAVLDVSTTGYDILDLGTLAGGRTSEAYDVNTLEQVVGIAEIDPGGGAYERRAVRWQAGSATDLSGPGDSLSLAYAINDAGTVVGWRIAPGGKNDAFRWDPLGGRTLLPSLGGAWSRAYDLNDAGTAVGGSELPSGDRHATLWQGAVAQDLGTLGGPRSSAVGINNADQVVGWSDYLGQLQGFLWQSGVMTPLVYPGGSLTRPYAINDTGVVVGFAYVGGTFLAWRWEAGVFTQLPGVGEAITLATDVNGSGQAVGQDWTGGGASHALVWEGGITTDLGAPVPPVGAPEWGAARGSNDLGVVVGLAHWPDGFIRAARWAGPAPAPQAIVVGMADAINAMGGAGVIGAGAANALTAKLGAALASLDRDRDNAAVNQLESFINQVEAMVSSDRLAEPDGDALIGGAESAIEGIQAG